MKGVVSFCAALVGAIILLVGPDAEAQSWFDKMKNKAREAVEGAVSDESNEAEQKAKQSAAGKTNTSSSSSSSASQKAQPTTQKTATYGQTVGAADNLIKKWPYEGVKGGRVANIELQGVKLGMPVPTAIKALEKEGYSKVTGLRFAQMKYEYNGKRRTVSQADYANLPPNERGNIIRSYVVELTAITPSEEIMKQLPPYPEAEKEAGLTADEKARCEKMKSRDRSWAQGLSVAEYKDLRTKCRSSGSNAQKPDPQYVSRIWYGQKFISGEKPNYEKFLAGAKKRYGEPTYAYNGTIHMAGAAFNRQGMIWYVDSALVPKSKIYELLKKSDDGQRSMIFKDFLHPGNASNGYYVKAYNNSFEDMVEAVRVGYAPHMAVGYERSSYVVDLEWPFLSMEKSYRELWNKEKAYEAQPEAEFDF